MHPEKWETNAMLYAKGIKGAKITIIPGEVGHITNPEEGDIEEQKIEQVNNLAYQFFEELWSKGERSK